MIKISTFIAFTFLPFFTYSQYNPYIRQQPIQEMRDVGMYKQRLYNERSEWTKNQIQDLYNSINSLYDVQKLPSDFQVSYHRSIMYNEMKKFINQLNGIDLANNYSFNSIENSIETMNKYIYDYYNYEVKIYNERK